MENLDIEIWKDIPGFDGKYQASNFGFIRSKYGHLIKFQDSYGYCRVTLKKYGTTHNVRYCVHRLIYETFVGPIPKGMYINHLDENKSNNRIDNLNIVTPKENINYGTCIERRAKKLINCPNSSKRVMCIETGITYPSTREAWRQTGILYSTISSCCRNERKNAGGYHWRYV